MPRFPVPLAAVQRLRAANDAHSLGALAREAGVCQRTAASAVAGAGVYPVSLRALLEAADRLDAGSRSAPPSNPSAPTAA
jgi:hypothetical protein